MIPIYRILKYHLLLKNICDYTDQVIIIDSMNIRLIISIDVGKPQSHEDYQGLCLAHEAMIDISEYINEARRDCEMRQILTDVQVEFQ